MTRDNALNRIMSATGRDVLASTKLLDLIEKPCQCCERKQVSHDELEHFLAILLGGSLQ